MTLQKEDKLRCDNKRNKIRTVFILTKEDVQPCIELTLTTFWCRGERSLIVKTWA